MRRLVGRREARHSDGTFHNGNDGKFTNVTDNAGAIANMPDHARSAAWADVNMDGNLDLIVVGTSEALTMVEAGGDQIPEDTILEALELAHAEIRKICAALGGTPPEGFNYELFLDDKGQKISKSKGNGLTIDEWLRYASPESLSLFMYREPKAAKRLRQYGRVSAPRTRMRRFGSITPRPS